MIILFFLERAYYSLSCVFIITHLIATHTFKVFFKMYHISLGYREGRQRLLLSSTLKKMRNLANHMFPKEEVSQWASIIRLQVVDSKMFWVTRLMLLMLVTNFMLSTNRGNFQVLQEHWRRRKRPIWIKHEDEIHPHWLACRSSKKVWADARENHYTLLAISLFD